MECEHCGEPCRYVQLDTLYPFCNEVHATRYHTGMRSLFDRACANTELRDVLVKHLGGNKRAADVEEFFPLFAALPDDIIVAILWTLCPHYKTWPEQMRVLLDVHVTAVRLAYLVERYFLVSVEQLDVEMVRNFLPHELLLFPRLRSLDLGNNSRIQSKTLAQLTGLTTLGLAGNTVIRDEALYHMKSLTALDLSGTYVYPSKGKQKRLETPRITGRVLARLSDSLTSLSLVDNTTVYNLEALRRLTRLTLSDKTADCLLPAQLTELYAGAELLYGEPELPPGLRVLKLVASISPARFLPGLTALTTLDLTRVLLGEDLPLIATLTRLSLHASTLPLHEEITRLTGLTALELDDTTSIGDATLRVLTTLTELTLTSNRVITINAIEALTRLVRLGLSHNSMIHGYYATRLPQLTALDLSHSTRRRIQDHPALYESTGFDGQFLVYLPTLTELNLSNNIQVSIEELTPLTNLQKLRLSTESRIQKEDLSSAFDSVEVWVDL